MIKKKAIVFSLAFWSLIPSSSFAQFLNLQLRIEPEISTVVEQHLDFGTIITNSGRKEILLGDANMGIFSVKAIYSQNLFIELQTPESLEHRNPAVKDQIPIELSLSYNNQGSENPYDSQPLPTGGSYIPVIGNRSFVPNRQDIWREVLIYVYGAIEVGNVPAGVYENEIILSVVYD